MSYNQSLELVIVLGEPPVEQPIEERCNLDIKYPSSPTLPKVEYPDSTSEMKKLVTQLPLVLPTISTSCNYTVQATAYSIEGVEMEIVQQGITFDEKGEQLQFYSTLGLSMPQVLIITLTWDL